MQLIILVDDFSAQGDNEHHRHACDCSVLHNPLLYARCQSKPQSKFSDLIAEEFQQTSPAADLEPPAPGEEVDAEEPSAFAGVGKIMQVEEDNSDLALIVVAGFPYCPYHAGVQAGSKICGAPVHCVHCEDQLQGPRASLLPRLHGHAGLWQSPLLCGERGA